MKFINYGLLLAFLFLMIGILQLFDFELGNNNNWLRISAMLLLINFALIMIVTALYSEDKDIETDYY